MSYDVSIEKSLFEVYPEIRLGLMTFKANVKDSDDAFWSYMDGEILPQVRKEIEGKENMLVLADDEGIFGSSMSDSTRAMVTDEAKDILVVVYCFENDIDLNAVLEEGRAAFKKYAAAKDIECWIR